MSKQRAGVGTYLDIHNFLKHEQIAFIELHLRTLRTKSTRFLLKFLRLYRSEGDFIINPRLATLKHLHMLEVRLLLLSLEG